MGKPSGPELQLKKWLWTCLTWPASQFYPGFQWARLIQTYRTTCGLWLEHSAHWAIGSITWATLSPSGQFGSPSIQRWQTIADHLPCTARIISRTGYVKYITALRLSALWVRQSSNARGAPSFLQIMKINGAVTKHIQKQIDAKTTWRTLVRISVSRSDEEWAHPRSSPPHKLVNSRRAWHPLPLFPGQRAMWNIPHLMKKHEKSDPHWRRSWTLDCWHMQRNNATPICHPEAHNKSSGWLGIGTSVGMVGLEQRCIQTQTCGHKRMKLLWEG